jgi:DNA-binding response OmpR family regulator
MMAMLTMRLRITVLDIDESIRKLITVIAESKGHEVVARTEPDECPLYSDDEQRCTKGHACTDLLIISNKMMKMSGPKLISKQLDHGCKCSSQNKLVLSTTTRRTREFTFAEKQGFKVIMKPFRVSEISDWIDECEKRIDPKRKLNPSQ